MNPTPATLIPGVVSPTTIQAEISTNSSAPDSYTGRASIPCSGFTFSVAATGTVSETSMRVFILTANPNIPSGTMNASGLLE